MDRLQSIRLFVRTIELGSFSEAAIEANISQSSASRAIASLEASLGVRLLNRTSRALSPTQEGLDYQERCARILADLDAADDFVRQTQRSPSGTLRVAISTLLGQVKIMPIVADFMNAYPEIKVEMAISDDPVDIVSEGIDLAVRVGNLVDSGLIAKRVGIVKNILVASARYLERHGTPTRPGELSHHQCLVLRSGSVRRNWKLLTPNGETVVEVSAKLVFGNHAELMSAALAGFGIAILSEWSIREHLKTNALVQVLPTAKPQDRPVHLVFQEGGNRVAKTRALIDFLEARIKLDPDFM